MVLFILFLILLVLLYMAGLLPGIFRFLSLALSIILVVFMGGHYGWPSVFLGVFGVILFVSVTLYLTTAPSKEERLASKKEHERLKSFNKMVDEARKK